MKEETRRFGVQGRPRESTPKPRKRSREEDLEERQRRLEIKLVDQNIAP